MRWLIFVLALSACGEIQRELSPGYVAPPMTGPVYLPFQGLDPEPFMNHHTYQAPPTTWCRSDGYGGMYCS